MIKDIHIDGLEELSKTLNDMAPRESVALLRGTTAKIAKNISEDVVANAPVDTGRLRGAVRSRRRRGNQATVEAGVYIDKGTSRADNNGAWYWHFIEFGTSLPHVPARPFIFPAYERARQNFKEVFKKEFYKKLASRLRRQARKAGK